MRPDRLYLLDIVEAADNVALHVNLVVHEYFGLDWRIVWRTATELTPALRSQVTAILQAEFPDENAPPG